MGASIVERHFVIFFRLVELACSMDIGQAKELIKASKIIFQERGGSKNLIKKGKGYIGFCICNCCNNKRN